MRLDLGLLKKHLHDFAFECNLTIAEIGELAENSASVEDFKTGLDKLCLKNINKTSSEVLAEFTTRFAVSNTPPKPQPTENSPLQNEIVEVGRKLDLLEQGDKTTKNE